MFGLAKCMNVKALTYFSTERIQFKKEITKILLKLDAVLANSALCSAKSISFFFSVFFCGLHSKLYKLFLKLRFENIA